MILRLFCWEYPQTFGQPRPQIYRARFSAAIPEEIQRAWHCLQAGGGDRRLKAMAREARSIIDLKVGTSFSRGHDIMQENPTTCRSNPVRVRRIRRPGEGADGRVV